VRAAVAAGPSLVQSSHLKAAAGCDAGSPQYLSGNTEMAAAWPVCHLWAAKQSVVVCVHGNTGDGARECSCIAPWGHAGRQTSRQAGKQESHAPLQSIMLDMPRTIWQHPKRSTQRRR
jgi:hypothetical protein